MLMLFFLKHRKYCQRVPSYLLFSPFESFYPNDWVHNSFHLCEISSGYECICVVWMLFLLHVARVKVDATCIQTALSLLILGLNSLYLSRWWGLALSSCWIKHFYPTVWEILIFVFEEKKKSSIFYFFSEISFIGHEDESVFIPTYNREVCKEPDKKIKFLSGLWWVAERTWFVFYL